MDKYTKNRYSSSKTHQKVSIQLEGKLHQASPKANFSHLSRSHQLLAPKNQLCLQDLITIFASHYKSIQSYFKTVELEMTKLQAKISSLSGKFNAIQWKLSKGVYQLHQSHLLNEQLVKINNEIEEKLNIVKQDYQDLKKRKYVGNLEKKIEELKECTHRLEIEHYKNKFHKQDALMFQDNIDRLDQIVKKNAKKVSSLEREVYLCLLGDLVKAIKGQQDMGRWLQEKVQENIKLKIQIVKYSSTIRKDILQEQQQQKVNNKESL